MEKVNGIGGIFFRAHNPAALKQWYQQHLGVTITPSESDMEPWRQEAGATAFEPFPEDTDYFGEMKHAWMINFRVGDLDAMVAQLRAAQIEVQVNTEAYPIGRFARLSDPEGNPIELWEPKGTS
jgi:glyoxylase I family protein